CPSQPGVVRATAGRPGIALAPYPSAQCARRPGPVGSERRQDQDYSPMPSHTREWKPHTESDLNKDSPAANTHRRIWDRLRPPSAAAIQSDGDQDLRPAPSFLSTNSSRSNKARVRCPAGVLKNG